MRFELGDKTAVVYLSRRNLKALTAKLDGYPEDSAMTIHYTSKNGEVLTVTAEEDAVHYANPERDVLYGGEMHPATEARIK